jgi:alpha/beta superfamily hydrolase
MEEKVTFQAGNLTLEGLLWTPAGGGEKGAVLCHPHPLYGGDMHNNVVSALAEALQKQNIATLRFNFRGTGQSEGSHGGGEAEKEDVKAAVSYLLSRQAVSTLAVVGYSFGAAVGLRAGAEDARVSALVGVALPVGMRDASFLLSCTKAKLFVAGDQDNFCPLPALKDLFAKCPEPKEMTVIPGTDHFFWGQEAEVARAVVEFLGRE